MKRPLFNDVNPLKNNRITRSHLKRLQQIKRVINVDHDKDNFQHFCSTTINDRIPNISAIANPEKAGNSGFSKKFLDRHYIEMDNMKPRVTILPKLQLLSDVQHLKINCDESNNNIIDTTKHNDVIIDITGDISVECIDVDDDVILLPNPAEQLVVSKVEDSILYIPLEASTNDTEIITENVGNTSCSSNFVVDIPDTNEDIIFVSENTPNKNNCVLSPVNLKFSSNKKNSTKPKQSLDASTNLKMLKFTSKKGKKTKNQKKRKNKTKIKNTAFQFLSNNTMQLLFSTEVMKRNLQSNLKQTCDSEVQENNLCTPLVNKIVNRFQAKQNTPKLSLSFNDFQNNMCNLQRIERKGLREIIIDGSNVAIGHSNNRFFSVKGLQIAIEYFLKKGHKVTAFVPQYRKKPRETSDQALLNRLADKGYVVFTPSREINGRRITPYDDRYIIQYATACEGIVVSSDNYRDLFLEKPEWRETIEKRLLMPTWVGDVLMFPEDPLGRHGPRLESFLRFPQ